MAAHYDVAIIPTWPRKPRDKAKVEAGVLLAERWILARLRDQRFCSLAEANIAIAACVAAINERPFRKLPGSRRSWFDEIDRPAMRPLPASRYSLPVGASGCASTSTTTSSWNATTTRFLISSSAHASDAQASATTVEVLRARRVASHRRDDTPGRHTTDAAHMPVSHRRHAEWSPSRILSWAARTGPATAGLADASCRHLIRSRAIAAASA